MDVAISRNVNSKLSRSRACIKKTLDTFLCKNAISSRISVFLRSDSANDRARELTFEMCLHFGISRDRLFSIWVFWNDAHSWSKTCNCESSEEPIVCDARNEIDMRNSYPIPPIPVNAMTLGRCMSCNRSELIISSSLSARPTSWLVQCRSAPSYHLACLFSG